MIDHHPSRWSVGCTVFSKAMVDGKIWYSVATSTEIHNWIMEQTCRSETYRHLTTHTWESICVDIPEDLYLLLKLKFGV